MPEARANGVRLYYEERGEGDPILLIHGTSSSALVWQPSSIDALAALGRLIVYDRRGCTRSERPEPYETNVRQHAEDAAALLEALEAMPAVVIGRSYGGETAAELTMRHPGHVRALVLLEAAALNLDAEAWEWEEDLRRAVEEAAARDLSSVAETFLRRVLGDSSWESFKPDVRHMFVDNSPAILAEFRGGPLDATAEDLATISVPTLLVAGEASPPAFRRVTERMASAIPNARTVLVGGGHFIDPGLPEVVSFVARSSGNTARIVRSVRGDGVTERHVLLNRAMWDADAPDWVERGRAEWAADEPTWGIWGNPESELHLLEEVEGLDAVDLGCGTGYASAHLARRGARPVALDNSIEQLRTAKAFQDEFGIRFPLVHADGERPPFADGSFDLAFSEYGAAIWCDPYRWIPEAARILRPGGRLVFLGTSATLMLCYPPDDDEAPAGATLHRDYFGMHRFEWHDANGAVDSVEFHLTHAETIRLLRSCGFEVEELLEPPPPPDVEERGEPYVPLAWARRWPSVEAWKVRKVREA